MKRALIYCIVALAIWLNWALVYLLANADSSAAFSAASITLILGGLLPLTACVYGLVKLSSN